MTGCSVVASSPSSRQGGGRLWRDDDAGEVHDVLWEEWTEEEEDEEDEEEEREGGV